MSETYPKKDPLRNAFRRTYFPPAQESTAKVRKICEMCKFWVEKVLGVLTVLEMNAAKTYYLGEYWESGHARRDTVVR